MSNAAQKVLSSQRPVWLAALLTGLIAILFNTVMLEFEHQLGIDTGHDRSNKRHEAAKPRSYSITPVAPLLLPES